MQTEQQEGRSQDERDKTDLRAFFTPDRTKCSGSDLPGAMSTPPKNRFLFKYKDFMTTFKDDNERAENQDMTNSNNFKANTGIVINDLDHYKPNEGKAESDESTRKDPTFDEYHNMKGEEDDDSKPNFTIEITQLLISPRGTATKSCRFSVDALKEVAGPREFTILQFYNMSRSFSERIILHIGGF